MRVLRNLMRSKKIFYKVLNSTPQSKLRTNSIELKLMNLFCLSSVEDKRRVKGYTNFLNALLENVISVFSFYN